MQICLLLFDLYCGIFRRFSIQTILNWKYYEDISLWTSFKISKFKSK